MSELDGYFEDLKRDVEVAYVVASEARKKGFDPENEVECPLALTMAERAVNLVKTIYPKLNVSKISGRILELEDEFGQLDTTVAFVIAREIAEGKFGKFEEKLDGIDCGARVGFAYLTLGVVASPIEGYTGLRLGKTRGGEDYFVVSFSGPIRSAGTTAVCLFLFLLDYLREAFGFVKYDSIEEEVGRCVTEIEDFHNKVTNLQYFPTREEIEFLAVGLPVQLDGDPTERLEVSNFKDLKRVSTNRIRGGFCLVFGEALALKAPKALGRLDRVRENLGEVCSGWDYLKGYVEVHKKRESGEREVEATYIKDLVAGRPVYGHPGRSGTFRFRYGRSRTSGFSSVGVHPATMGVTGGFLSHGTQLRFEKPTKAGIITSVDSIDGPIVKLKNGSVRKISDYEEGLRLYKDGEIEEILYLGDILFPIGDVIDRNADLVKPGYVEEWWEKEVFSKLPDDVQVKISNGNCGIFDATFTLEDNEKLDEFSKILKICKKLEISLHPDFIFYWSQISGEELVGLLKWLNSGVVRGDKLVLNWEDSRQEEFNIGKRALEILGVRHEVVLDNVVIEEDFLPFLYNLGKGEVYNGETLEFKVDEVACQDVLGFVNSVCDLEVKDKWGTGIGARMGRPEKAKMRALAGSPNVLFSVGDQGGRMKSVQEAMGVGFVKNDFPLFKCECGKEGVFGKCECGKVSNRMNFCSKCGEIMDGGCKIHGETKSSWNRKVEIKEVFDSAVKNLGLAEFEISGMVKGVSKINSESRVQERLEKGILRAKFGLSVNKDGTVRYDATEICLTHFKPIEIGASIERLKELGYLKDIYGEDLVSDYQVLELRPHDVVLPDCLVLGEESADKSLIRVANFVDEELKRLYGIDGFYNIKEKGDLVGQKVVCMAPHNCAGVVGRIIGFSNMQGLLASPFMHAAMRRDCDGDEASVMLLMDVLLNFSRAFLPSHRGGSQDAPLVLNSRIREGEVDDQVLFFESLGEYPLSLYEAASSGKHSSEVKEDIELIGDKLRIGKSGFVGNGFTHDTVNFNFGCNNGIYKTIPTMKEKVDAQMDLAGKLRGVDQDDVARLVLERHFIRDIRGNLRKFCRQEFRCIECGEKYRRIPLKGSCYKCDGKIIFTVSEGSVRKYIEPAMELMNKYKISGYTRESIELIGDYIDRIFGKGEEQSTL